MEQEKKDTNNVVVQSNSPYSQGYAATKRSTATEVASEIAEKAFFKAKLLTGWKRWVAIVIGTLAAGAAAWLMNGCAAVVSKDASGVTTSWVVVIPINK